MSRPLMSVKKEVWARDEHSCVKCGSKAKLECHHIIPHVYGGSDEVGNLITLCKGCHKFAPDEPLDLLKYVSKHLPFGMERSKELTKIAIEVVLWKFELVPREPHDQLNDKMGEINLLIDEFYTMLWNTYMSQDIQELVKFMNKFNPGSAPYEAP